MKRIESFENKVLTGLERCGFSFDRLERSRLPLGIAVSGGADSVSLLVSLARIFNKTIPLKVITINHNIRSEQESRGDAEFVKALCEKLALEGASVSCKIVEIERNLITTQAAADKTGIEDSARSFRYSAFEKFIDEEGLCALCLAHTQNDQLETVLMRFLQGNDSDSVAAIPYTRGKYIRPLLDITRDEIERYLNELDLSWRTDNTNFDTKYLRNKIRNKLVPFLDEHFEGWQGAVLSGVEKSEMNRELISALTDKVELFSKADSVYFKREDFDSAPDAIKYQLLLKGFNALGVSQRIPFAFLREVIACFESAAQTGFSGKILKKRFSDVEILLKKDIVLFEKAKKSNTDLVFFDIIEETGEYDFPFGKVEVFRKENTLYQLRINGLVMEHCFSLPVCIQNAQPGDCIQSSDGSMRKLSDIYSDWHVPAELRPMIPILLELKQNEFVPTCIFGKISGFKDWIVYEKN
jgi:tRNA(Ile)-lysidine synthase